jgi:hypothetical protein
MSLAYWSCEWPLINKKCWTVWTNWTETKLHVLAPQYRSLKGKRKIRYMAGAKDRWRFPIIVVALVSPAA